MQTLRLIFGDQLDRDSAIFDDFLPDEDLFWMAECDEEIRYVPSHKQRIVLFLSAMRHFRDELMGAGKPLRYHALTPDGRKDRGNSFEKILAADILELKPKRIAVVQPGDWRVLATVRKIADEFELELSVLEDRHFYCSVEEFAKFADCRKTLLLETFYRRMRKKHKLLMDGDKPEGGDWNYDKDNREPFPKSGPGTISAPTSFNPDATTQEVIDLVAQRYADHPGEIDSFNLPVTPGDARRMRTDFISKNLPEFGKYEDAMWTDEPFGHHSRLSVAMNIKLLNPRECVEPAIAAYNNEHASLPSVEGFVRQIVGWREFIRGVYWNHMPKYAEGNHFRHQANLPEFYWNGKTDMTCVQQSMKHVLQYGYAHHIHRLMVLGNLSLLLGVHPYQFHQWHMAMYIDAIDWVSLPNTLGMSQHGDGGVVGTKPYVATGNYIHKMSNFCKNCRFDYRKSTGEDACPITTLYWDFLDRNYDTLSDNSRMKFQMKHIDKKREKGEIAEIQKQADLLRRNWKRQSPADW